MIRNTYEHMSWSNYDEEVAQRSMLREMMEMVSLRQKKTLVALLKSIREIPENGEVDLLPLPRDLIATLWWVVTREILTADDMGQRIRWFRHKTSLSEDFYNAAEELRGNRIGTMPASVQERVQMCLNNLWPMHEIVYVRPALHNGIDVGLGLFAMIHLKRGQQLFQFTGRVVPFDRAYSDKGQRQHYIIKFRYGTQWYLTNPLAGDDKRMDPRFYVGYVNEPSAPPWTKGDDVRVGSNEATYVGYDHKTGTSSVEYKNKNKEAVKATAVAAIYPQSPVDTKVLEANTFWYNFPVPLTGLYTPDGQDLDTGLYRYRRIPDAKTAVVQWSIADFFKEFDTFSDGDGVWQLEENSKISVNHMVYLKIKNQDEVFVGLERYGVVRRVAATGVTVLHAVTANALWRLPRIVTVGKAARCSSCTAADNPMCMRCTVVPFPLVYACKNIKPNQELLCLYEKPIKTRGLACTKPLYDADMLPRWNDY